MQDKNATKLMNLICSTVSSGSLDKDALLEDISLYCNSTGESFRGRVSVTETSARYGVYSCSVTIGNPGREEQYSSARSTGTLPSKVHYDILIDSYPELGVKEIIGHFVDEDGNFVRNVVYGQWDFDRYTAVSNTYAAYGSCSAHLANDVNLIFDEGDVWVSEDTNPDEEIRIRSDEELRAFLLARTY